MDAREKSSNEKRLIDSNALNERFDKRIKWLRLDMHDQYSLGLYHGAVTDKDLINEMPIVDAVEVVHGYWYEHYGIAICSHCHSMFDHDLKMLQVPSTYKMPNYCPNCGAKMDGDVEREEGAN